MAKQRPPRNEQKFRSKIVGNKKTLNAPLKMITPADPLRMQLDKISGDVSNPNRLLSNILETINFSLKFPSNELFWSSEPKMPNIYSENNKYNWYTDQFISIPIEFNTELKTIRQQLKGHEILNRPLDSDEDECVMFVLLFFCLFFFSPTFY